MKSNSDNFRASAIIDILTKLSKENVAIIIYEPTIDKKTYNGYLVENNLREFKEKSDVIVANRISDDLLDVKDKVYTRDLFSRD